jgi:hypothetical protein
LRLLPLFDRARNSLFILGNLMIQNATEVWFYHLYWKYLKQFWLGI